ncbi:response regulator transcription factor [Microaerobacter geothermalis]|uniref:response regulator n=1 Tax=Microaerobacter geothermalis TaxID=674972 RepID=UPI001F33CF2B|nr:response regulator transcription factor [Microaerobacter geothermalis]MCF6093398.1 response regulator transcription factor [Microaerobacter geothermalis]
MGDRKITILLVDDHQLFREGIKRILNMEADFSVVGEAGDGETACQLAQVLQPDVILMDVNMPHMNGVEATEIIHQYTPESKVIILSIHDDEGYVQKTLRSGASGYLLKEMEAEELIDAVKAVSRGEAYIHPKVTGPLIEELRRLSEKEQVMEGTSDGIDYLLSPRELEVLQLMAEGMSNRSIGEKLFISEKTVKNHVSSILAKMEVQDRTHAVVTAIKKGWIHL